MQCYSSTFIEMFSIIESYYCFAAISGLKMRIRSRMMEHGGLDDCRALVEPPCAALEIRRGKGFERLHEARQGCLHHAGADLPDPCLAMGNAGVDPGHDGCFDDLVVSSRLLR